MGSIILIYNEMKVEFGVTEIFSNIIEKLTKLYYLNNQQLKNVVAF